MYFKMERKKRNKELMNDRFYRIKDWINKILAYKNSLKQDFGKKF